MIIIFSQLRSYKLSLVPLRTAVRLFCLLANAELFLVRIAPYWIPFFSNNLPLFLLKNLEVFYSKILVIYNCRWPVRIIVVEYSIVFFLTLPFSRNDSLKRYLLWAFPLLMYVAVSTYIITSHLVILLNTIILDV